MRNRWLTVYLFYPGDLDLMLSRLVAPFIQKFFREPAHENYYFFIRYWENGSHVRLRMNADPAMHEVLAKELKERSNSFFFHYPDLNEASSLNKNDLFDSHYIRFTTYEPETERYGDQRSLPWAEAHFFSSSAFILDWINTRKIGASVLIQALRMHLVLFFALRDEIPRLIHICNFFIDGWLPRLYQQQEDAAIQKGQWLKEFEISFNRNKGGILPAAKNFWDDLAAGTAEENVQELLNVNIQLLRNYQSAGFEVIKLMEIITSMLHMNNNRLGISNYEEAYGMYCTLQCLHFIAGS